MLFPVCLAPFRKTTGVSASAESKAGVMWRGTTLRIYTSEWLIFNHKIGRSLKPSPPALQAEVRCEGIDEPDSFQYRVRTEVFTENER